MKFVELVVAMMALFTRMRDVNTELTKQVAHFRRRRPRSETLRRVERQMVLVFAGAVLATSQPSAPEPKAPRSRRGRHPGRAALPASLERVVVENPVPAEMRICPRCGSDMKTVGHSVCEILEVIPAKVIVLQRKDETVACPHDDTIVSAPTPPELVERGKLGPTLIVEAVADKFIEHLPIERQCLRYARAGVPIAPQTLGRSVAAAIDLIAAIARIIESETRAPGLLGTDATTIPILDHDAPDGIRLGTMWCWTNARWVSFFYSPAGDSDSVRRFLGDDLSRIVQCDGTSVTTFIERAGGSRPGCMAHGRRRLAVLARGGDLLAYEGLQLIKPLFAIEKAASLAGDDHEARRARPALPRLLRAENSKTRSDPQPLVFQRGASARSRIVGVPLSHPGVSTSKTLGSLARKPRDGRVTRTSGRRRRPWLPRRLS